MKTHPARLRRFRTRRPTKDLPWGRIFPVVGIMCLLAAAAMQTTLGGLMFCGVCLIGMIGLLVVFAVKKT